ncbi:MAG TPA: hypothetical protein VMU32_06530 [Solirubrobacteraceae bacterium]|nr:hypothetical protein [Solirubrobacteraceae bacterium]
MELPGRARSESEKISFLDRRRVLDVIEECRAEGYLDDDERALAVAQVEASVNRQMLDEVRRTLPNRAH